MTVLHIKSTLLKENIFNADSKGDYLTMELYVLLFPT